MRVGLEVEEVTELGPITGPVVVGRVVEFETLTKFKKPIRYCQVHVAEDEHEPDAIRGIICGATNSVEGDLVVVALPGAVLPGGFAISKRDTYGRASDGMICAASELGLSDDHSGILVLPPSAALPGSDALELVQPQDAVIELSITPDRGYCVSVRGQARELACALDAGFSDPAGIDIPPADGDGWTVTIAFRPCPRSAETRSADAR